MAFWQVQETSSANSKESSLMLEKAASFEQSQLDSLLKYALRGIEFSDSSTGLSDLKQLYYLSSVAVVAQGENERALLTLQKLDSLVRSHTDWSMLIEVAYMQARAYSQKGEYERAFESVKQSLEKATRDNEEDAIPKALFNMGGIYLGSELYRPAIRLIQQAGRAARTEITEVEGISDLYLAKAYLALDQPDSTEYYLKHFSPKLQDSSYTRLFPQYFQLLSEYHLYRGNMEEMLINLEKGINISLKTGSLRYLSQHYSLLSEVLMKSDIDSARQLAMQAYELAAADNYQEVATAVQLLLKTGLKSDWTVLTESGLRDLSFNIQERIWDQRTEKSVMLKYLASEEMNEMNEQFSSELKAVKSKRNLERSLLLLGLFSTMVTVFWFLYRYYQKSKNSIANELSRLEKMEQSALMEKEEKVNERGVPPLIFDRTTVEAQLSKKLNETDWAILELLQKDPLISNKAISVAVDRTTEGVSSSLRKMYRLFEINVTSNKKLALLKRVVSLSAAE